MNPARTVTLALTAIFLAASVAACGGSDGGGGPQGIVDEATLDGVESGKLDLSMKIDVRGSEGGKVDVDLSGPFETGADTEATKLDLNAAVKGTVEGEAVDFEGGLTLLGGADAYVEFEGGEYEVEPTTYGYATATIGESEEISACREALSDRRLSEFIEEPVEEGTARVGGATTTKVSGDVDPEAAAEALVELTEDSLCSEQLKAVPGLGPTLAKFEESEGEARSSIEDAHIVLYVGDDGILRRLQAQVAIVPPAGTAPKGTRSAEVDLDLTLADVNQPQRIAAPKKSEPLNELLNRLEINSFEVLSAVEGGAEGGGLSALIDKFVQAVNSQ